MYYFIFVNVEKTGEKKNSRDSKEGRKWTGEKCKVPPAEWHELFDTDLYNT